MASNPRQPFLPSARQANWLIAAALLSLGYALYLRYLVIEQSTVGLACQGGLKTLALFHAQHRDRACSAIRCSGSRRLRCALLNLLRPSLPLLGAALIVGGFGIVLYNVALSSLASALLILSLARPAPAPEAE